MTETWITVLVNGTEHRVLAGCELTYEHLVAMAGLHEHPTVVFHKRIGEWVRSGSLHQGQAMTDLRDGTRFTVIHTGVA